MTVRAKEQRRSSRMPAAHPVVLRTRKGRLLAKARTANISENGVFVLARFPKGPPRCTEVIAEIFLPTASGSGRKRPARRSVRYRCRVARATEMVDS